MKVLTLCCKPLATCIFISTLLLSACSNTHGEVNAEVKKLMILHTNDHHGRFWHNDHGEYGMAARKTLLDRLRAQAKLNGQEVILLSGGDINTGIPESDMQQAEPDFKGMALLGYDAMAIGNHEFDNPVSVLAKQQAWAGFPFLSANIIDRTSNKHAYQPSTIITKGEIKVALVGLTTTDTEIISNPDYVGHLAFTKPSTAAKLAIEQIQQTQSVDITIAVTHMGHYVDAKHGINAPGDVTLARELPTGMLDVIIGGHSQEPICMLGENDSVIDYHPGNDCQPDKQNDTWIMQAHEWGKYVGKAEFEISNDEVKLTSYQLIPVNLTRKQTIANGEITRSFIGEEIEKSPEIYEFLLPYQQKGEAKILVPFATVKGLLNGDRAQVRNRQTNLGNLIATAQKKAVNADFGIISSGGIRGSIESGEVNYKQILSIHPFKNRITYVDMTGSEVEAYLKIVAAFPPDSGAYAQFSGVSFQVINGAVTNILIQEKPIEKNRTYRFSLNSYNAAGGDGYPKLLKHKGYVATSLIDAEILRTFLSKNSPLDASNYKPVD
ncbi:bifunctional UDP-sugar hydrolase/5'-nucleotidase UshA [Colwellia sp. RSH04]|uniref:bifunctional UDP-sugar hydrolase/5'-nucleotidase UshA n=1 Tax=Colwellia sp. RSH04 TaxID=2305464 RepID=UPI000E576B05|nr:bifunctional UDP-sugar hydrolase/5'-nucleotidase UshA [Colwellia sp. RSH04]RHW74731.1 bifunctional UDP-sugar hydrolase/5'-nucleotidase [Colwellia sp. RSH04]